MIEKLKGLNEALPGILFIDLMYLIIGEVIIIAFLPDKLACAIGYLVGVLYAVFCIFHMSFHIRKVVYGGADSNKSMVASYGVRIAVLFLVVLLLYAFNIGNILAAIVGMFAMKISAYLQPYFQKIASRILKKGG